MTSPLNKGSNHGFTLIEMMVVVVILGILAMVIVPRIADRPERVRQDKAKVDIVTIGSALRHYKIDNGKYPTTEQGLKALVQEPESGPAPKRWFKGGYLEGRKVPRDPWGNEFVYVSPGVYDDFDITSYGADGAPGGQDYDGDINSWEIE